MGSDILVHYLLEFYMKLFAEGGEIRLTKEDLRQLLETSIDKQLTGITTVSIKVADLSLHPNNKYVARLTLG